MKIEYKGRDIDPFEEYAKIKLQLEALEKERKELEMVVIDFMDDLSTREKETPYGYFHSMSRASWEYSKDVEDMSNALSMAKKEEQLKKIATMKKVTSYIMFSKSKKKGGE